MKFLLIAVLLLVVVDNGLSLKCYTCVDSKNCKSIEFDCDKASFPDPVCFKFDGKKDDQTIVAKSCSIKIPTVPVNDCEKDFKYQGGSGTVCTCSTDLCNNANVKMISQYMMFALIAVTTLFQFV